VKSLDLEWIANNWQDATEADRLAAGKEMRKRLREGMTRMESLARACGPFRGEPGARAGRVIELRRQGLSLKEAAHKARDEAREESAHLPAWQPDDAPEIRRWIREAIDDVVRLFRIWAELCPSLEPAWSDLERRALNLHDQLRRDDLTVKE
jgi:hypothetical protein